MPLDAAMMFFFFFFFAHYYAFDMLPCHDDIYAIAAALCAMLLPLMIRDGAILPLRRYYAISILRH